MTREEALLKYEMSDDGKFVINHVFDQHEAEHQTDKARIAELEADKAFYELHKSGFLSYVANLEAELKQKEEDEADLLLIAYMQGSGKTERLRQFARKTYDELQELKSGVVAEHIGTINEIIGMLLMASYDTEAEEYEAIIREKKQ